MKLTSMIAMLRDPAIHLDAAPVVTEGQYPGVDSCRLMLVFLDHKSHERQPQHSKETLNA